MPLLGRPARTGYRPVNNAAREGAQTGAAAYQFVNREPLCASWSIFGVFKSFAPTHARSWHPMSSARKRMMLGGLPEGMAEPNIAALEEERKSRRESMPRYCSARWYALIHCL